MTTEAMRRDFDVRFRAAYGEMRAHAMRLTRNQADAEELIQVAALKAWRFYDRFDGSCFPAWFTIVMKRVFLSQVRAARQHRAWDEDSVRFDDQFGSSRGDDAVMGGQLARAIAELPDRQREIFYRAVVEQYEYHEIAEDMAIPLGTVMTNVFRARQKLQKRLAA